ncbi:MAG TPA: hypothetical protein VFL83_01310 [Anaeromyxobacter sp.]|nr:hypothetical protein [Anaeromyxobacter sp.]
MARTGPAPRRSRTTTIPGGVRVVIPARKRPLASLFMAVWLCGWTVGGVAVIRQLVGQLLGTSEPVPLPVVAFMVVWLALWAVAEALVAAALAWSLAGREVISLSGATLRIRREAFRIGRTAEYGAASVRNLRAAPVTYRRGDGRSPMQAFGIGGGPIAFDHGAATRRFGAGLDEAEAEEVARALRERLPSSS